MALELIPFDHAQVQASFTGCRLREILDLKWSEVDFERGILNLSDSKTGRKPVILNAPALSIIAAGGYIASFAATPTFAASSAKGALT